MPRNNEEVLKEIKIHLLTKSIVDWANSIANHFKEITKKVEKLMGTKIGKIGSIVISIAGSTMLLTGGTVVMLSGVTILTLNHLITVYFGHWDSVLDIVSMFFDAFSFGMTIGAVSVIIGYWTMIITGSRTIGWIGVGVGLLGMAFLDGLLEGVRSERMTQEVLDNFKDD